MAHDGTKVALVNSFPISSPASWQVTGLIVIGGVTPATITPYAVCSVP
jgi:hypothetical protein